MSSPRLLVATILLAAACFTGCGGSPSAKLVGKWKMSGLSGADDNPLAGLFKLMNLSIEFKADGSCTMSIEGLGQTQSQIGTWKFVKSDGNDLVISMKLPPATQEGEVRIAFQDNDHCSFIPPAGLDKGGGKDMPKAIFAREK